MTTCTCKPGGVVAMRVLLSMFVVLLMGASAHAQVYHGNDTGGIISWSCEAEAEARAIAFHECARFDKYPRITSVHRRYGDYIAFQCLWSPHIARYQIPAVRVGARCAVPVPEIRAVVKTLY